MGSGMEIALANALGEITLALFTSLAPASAIAYVLMELPLFSHSLPEDSRALLNKALSLPLVLCMVGLIASATHLGNPANALYVIMGIGRSPLSNEVSATVAFLACAALIWLIGFAEGRHRTLQRVLMILVIPAALVFIGFVSFAYNVSTIITWATPFVPASIALGAFALGPIIASLGMHVAGCDAKSSRIGWVLIAVSVTAAVALFAVYTLQMGALSQVSNYLYSVRDIAPEYGWLLVAYAVLAVAASAVHVLSFGSNVGHPFALRLAASILMLLALFAMRFAFYLLHLTVGLGV